MSDSATLWIAARQAHLSIAFSRQEYWSGLPFPSTAESSPPRDQTNVSCISRWNLPSDLFPGHTKMDSVPLAAQTPSWRCLFVHFPFCLVFPLYSSLPPSAQFTWEPPAGQQDELTITSVTPPGIPWRPAAPPPASMTVIPSLRQGLHKLWPLGQTGPTSAFSNKVSLYRAKPICVHSAHHIISLHWDWTAPTETCVAKPKIMTTWPLLENLLTPSPFCNSSHRLHAPWEKTLSLSSL